MDAPAVEVKRALRAETRRRRRIQTPEARSRASVAAAANLLALPELEEAATVAFYTALADEVNPAPAIAALAGRGVRVVLPRVAGNELDLVSASGAAFVPGFRGVHEPTGQPIRVSDVDVAVVPGAAFDRSGGRLGRGGGHYDRLLVRLRPDALRVGLCFACQLVAAVPREVHDQPVDVVVDENGIFRTGARGW